MQKHFYRAAIATLISTSVLTPMAHANEAVTSGNAGQSTQLAAHAFSQTKQAFMRALWKQDPDTAMAAGKYTDAATLTLPDQATRQRYLQFIDQWLNKLSTVKAETLPVNDQTDLALIRNYLEGTRWYLTEFREYEWNPTQHNIAGGFDAILNTDFAPKSERVRIAIRRLQAVPAYYVAAQASIHSPTIEHTQLAIRQSAGALTVLSELEQAAATEKLTTQQKQALQTGLKNARDAVNGYVAFLTETAKHLTPETARSFRIGKALYEGKFKADIQSSFTAEQTYQRALAAKDEAHRNMEKLADQLWTKTMGDQPKPADRAQKIAMVIAKLSEQHIKGEDLFPAIRAQLPVLEKWIKDHHLLELDSTKPLIVRETPEYERGVTIASIEAPGIFRPHDNTYFNVTPFDGQSAEKIESTLREYNHWVLQILCIHEAIPGHYTQLQHANQSPSVIKTLFGNGAMIEGWAVYSERMMLESGYGENSPEMWLMYYKWNLRTVCNTILDYSVHVLGMTEAEAKDLLINQAFQTQAEADGKWNRVQYSSVQLASYFSGFSEILDLREQLKKQQGSQFDLKQFHEQFLSYGSAPVGMIKNMMLNGAGKH